MLVTLTTGDIKVHHCPPIQEFGYTDTGELLFEDDLCLDVSSPALGARVDIINCHGLGGNQKFDYNNQVSKDKGHSM